MKKEYISKFEPEFCPIFTEQVRNSGYLWGSKFGFGRILFLFPSLGNKLSFLITAAVDELINIIQYNMSFETPK